MTELNFDEIYSVFGGTVEPGPDGLGPYTPGSNPNPGCPNLEAFLRWRELNPFYGY